MQDKCAVVGILSYINYFVLSLTIFHPLMMLIFWCVRL